MARVFQEIFKPNSENVHIYLSKISALSSHYQKIAILLRNMDDKLANGSLYARRTQLSEEDKTMFRELKAIKSRAKDEMRAKGKPANIN